MCELKSCREPDRLKRGKSSGRWLPHTPCSKQPPSIVWSGFLSLVHVYGHNFLMYKTVTTRNIKKVQPGWITCWLEYLLSPLQCLSPELPSLLLLLLLLLADSPLLLLLLLPLLLLLLLLLLLPRFFRDCLASSFLCSLPGSLPSAEEAVEEEDELERGGALGSAQRFLFAASSVLWTRFLWRRVLFETSKNSSKRYVFIACSITFLWVPDKLLTTGFQRNTTSWPRTLQKVHQDSANPTPPS